MLHASDLDDSSESDMGDDERGDDESDDESGDLLSARRDASLDPHCKAPLVRDTFGQVWPNSEVFTSVRISVPQGHVIAPIYEEYLRILHGEGFVESWSWPHANTLSLQLPFGRVEKATNNSKWCQEHAPELSSADAWWARLRHLVAVMQLKKRQEEQDDNENEHYKDILEHEESHVSGSPHTSAVPTLTSSSRSQGPTALQTIIMPRGSVSREQRETGLSCLRRINVVDSWAWDQDDALCVVVNPLHLRAACANSKVCTMWATEDEFEEEERKNWGVCWLRLVWLTTQQEAFQSAVSDEEMHLDLETCLCSLHLHGLLPQPL